MENFPALKLFKVSRRFDCCMSPMIKPDSKPLILRRFPRISQPFFVLQKIKTLSGLSRFRIPKRSGNFLSLETWIKDWSISSTVMFSASIVISFASRVYSQAKFFT